MISLLLSGRQYGGQVREEYQRQSNELEDMREKLEARKLTLGDISIYTKKTLEDVKSQREQLCMETRMLLIAGKTLSAARQQLQVAVNFQINKSFI